MTERIDTVVVSTQHSEDVTLETIREDMVKHVARPILETCTDCHDGESPAFLEHHLGLPASAMDCRGCHDPHASQMAGMLLAQVHDPFAAGDCSLCHEAAEGDTP